MKRFPKMAYRNILLAILFINLCHEGEACRKDVTFIVDTSASILPASFSDGLDVMRSIVGELDISTNTTRVSLIFFSAQAHTSFYFDDYEGKYQLSKALMQVPHLKGQTNLAAGLKLWRLNHHFLTQELNRSSTIIIISDTNITKDFLVPYYDEVSRLKELQKNDGVEVIFIGVDIVHDNLDVKLEPDVEMVLSDLIDTKDHSDQVESLLHDGNLKSCLQRRPPYNIFRNTSCPLGHFGVNCSQACACSNMTENCAVRYGDCVSGCPSNYGGLGCQIQLPEPPLQVMVWNISFQSAIVAFKRSVSNPTGYRIAYRRTTSPTNTFDKWTQADQKERYDILLDDLAHDSSYLVRVYSYVKYGLDTVYSPASASVEFRTSLVTTRSPTKAPSTRITLPLTSSPRPRASSTINAAFKTTLPPSVGLSRSRMTFAPKPTFPILPVAVWVHVIDTKPESALIEVQTIITVGLTGYRVVYKQMWETRIMFGGVIKHEPDVTVYRHEVVHLQPSTRYMLWVVPNIIGIDGRPSPAVTFTTQDILMKPTTIRPIRLVGHNSTRITPRLVLSTRRIPARIRSTVRAVDSTKFPPVLSTRRIPPRIRSTASAVDSTKFAPDIISVTTHPKDHVLVHKDLIIGLSVGLGAGCLLFVIFCLCIIIHFYRRSKTKTATLPQEPGLAAVGHSDDNHNIWQQIRQMVSGSRDAITVQAAATMTSTNGPYTNPIYEDFLACGQQSLPDEDEKFHQELAALEDIDYNLKAIEEGRL